MIVTHINDPLIIVIGSNITTVLDKADQYTAFGGDDGMIMRKRSVLLLSGNSGGKTMSR